LSCSLLTRVRGIAVRAPPWAGDKGPSKQMTYLDVVGWILGGQKGTKAGRFFSIFFVVFLNSPHREMPKKRDKKIEKKSVLGFLSIFLYRLFDTILL
jgi:hypothetical protein